MADIWGGSVRKSTYRLGLRPVLLISIFSLFQGLDGPTASAGETIGGAGATTANTESASRSSLPVQYIPLTEIQNQRFPDKPATLSMGVSGSGQLVSLVYDGYDQNSVKQKKIIELGKLAASEKPVSSREPGPGKVLFHYDGWGIHLDTMVLNGKFDKKSQVWHLNIRYAYDSRTALLSGGNTPIFRNCLFDVKQNAKGAWDLARRSVKGDAMMVSSSYGSETILGLCGMTVPPTTQLPEVTVPPMSTQTSTQLSAAPTL